MFDGKSNYRMGSSNLATSTGKNCRRLNLLDEEERNLEKWPYDVIMRQSNVIYSITQH